MIDLIQWRATIGRLVPSDCSLKRRFKSKTGNNVLTIYHIPVAIAMISLALLVISGDIEVNPGPDARDIIKKVLADNKEYLSNALDGSLKQVAEQLYSYHLVSLAVKDTPTLNSIINEFEAALSSIRGVEQLEKHCQLFLTCIADQGGLAKLVAQKLEKEWIMKIQETLRILFQLNATATIQPTIDTASQPAVDTSQPIVDSQPTVTIHSTVDTSQSIVDPSQHSIPLKMMELRKVKKILAEVLRRNYTLLQHTLKDCLKDVAVEMYSSDLIPEEVKDSPTVDNVIGSFQSCLEWARDFERLNEHCQRLLYCISSQGGPAEKTAKEIESQWAEHLQSITPSVTMSFKIHPDERSSIDIKKITKILKTITRRNYALLSGVLRRYNLDAVADELYSENLITKAVREEPRVDNLIRNLEICLDLMESVKQLETQCQIILSSIATQSEEIAIKLANEWTKEVYTKLSVYLSLPVRTRVMIEIHTLWTTDQYQYHMMVLFNIYVSQWPLEHNVSKELSVQYSVRLSCEEVKSIITNLQQNQLQFMRLVGVCKLNINGTIIVIDQQEHFTFETSLLEASRESNYEAVEFLLQLTTTTDYQDKEEETALMIACRTGHQEIAEMLVSTGSDVNIQNTNGWTALMIASVCNHIPIVQTLLQANADPNLRTSDGSDALMIASDCGQVNIVQLLLKNKADCNYQREDNYTALMLACTNGHTQVVELLLKENVDPNVQDEDGQTALMLANKNEHYQVVELLLNYPNIQKTENMTTLIRGCENGQIQSVDVLQKSSLNFQKDGFDALMSACYNGHVLLVELLLKEKIDPNVQDLYGDTALMKACQNGHTQVVELLLKEKVDPNVQKEDGWTALMYACKNGHTQVVELLLKEKVDPNVLDRDDDSALLIAFKNSNIQVVELLLNDDQRIDIGVALIWACKNGYTPYAEMLLKVKQCVNLQDIHALDSLYRAHSYDHPQIVELLLNDSFFQKLDCWLLLLVACEERTSELIEILLKANVHFVVQEEYSQIALTFACKNGLTQFVELLLKEKVDPNVQQKDGDTALILACENDHTEVVKLILNDPNVQKKNSGKALLWACNYGQIQIFEMLLKANVSLNDQDLDGWTALMLACQSGYTLFVEMLLKAKADINIQNDRGETALMVACEKGNTQIVELLVKRQPNLNVQDEDGQTALIKAYFYCHFQVVELLLNDPNVQLIESGTALIWARKNSKIDFVEMLIKAKVGLNVQDEDGQTVLMWACENGYMQFVEILLKAKVHLNVQNENGQTALMLACVKGHNQIVELILKEKVDPNIQDEDGWTALMLACKNGHTQVIIELILKVDLIVQKEDSLTALMSACENDHIQVVELLLNDLNVQRIDFGVVLIWGCKNDHIEFVELLLKEKVRLNIQEEDSETALNIACENGNRQVAELLLR